MIYEGKQKIWSEYQKDIPDDHYFYVRSCIRQSFFPASEKVFLDITRNKLGKDFFETEHHTTCGGIAYHSDAIPQETSMTIIARQFAVPKTFDENGWLRIGFAGSQINMSEKYINTGSVYLCTFGFLALGLPPTDPFWSDPFTPWTGFKAWNGEDVKADHAIRD